MEKKMKLRSWRHERRKSYLRDKTYKWRDSSRAFLTELLYIVYQPIAINV